MVFNLFKKSCWFCGEKIEKGEELTRYSKAFCSEEHANKYEKKVEKQPSGGCCG